MIQEPRALPQRQSDPGPVFDGALKHRASAAEAVASIEQAIDLRAIARQLLHLVEVVVVGVARTVSLSWKPTSSGLGSGIAGA
jgi:hypothetical protein